LDTPPPSPLVTDTDALSSEGVHSDNFRRDQPFIWWATLIGPFVLTGGMLMVLALSRGYEFVAKLCGTAAVTFFGLGRFVILFGSDAPKADVLDTIATDASIAAEQTSQFNFLTRIELFTLVTWMDLLAATMLIFHMGFLFRIPRLGPALLTVREEGEFFMQTQPWIRRFTFLGLVAFVLIPVAATGSVGGALFGRLLGMSRLATSCAILSGTLLGNSLMLVAGKAIASLPFFNPNSPFTLIIGLGIVIGIILLLNSRYRKMKRDWKQRGTLAHPYSSVPRSTSTAQEK